MLSLLSGNSTKSVIIKVFLQFLSDALRTVSLLHSLIVGIEREGKRIMNPDTDSVLLTDDRLWLVGERRDMERLMKEES